MTVQSVIPELYLDRISHVPLTCLSRTSHPFSLVCQVFLGGPCVYPTTVAPSRLWCSHTKPTKYCAGSSPLSRRLVLPALADAGHTSEPTWQWMPDEENCPFFLAFLSGAAQGIIWGLGVFYLDSNTNPHGRLTCLHFCN